MLSIRQATNVDVPEIVRVIRAVYDEYGFPWEAGGYHADLYDIEQAYDAVGDRFYVAEVDGTVVGTVAIEVFNAIPGTEGTTVVDGYVRVCGTDFSLERLYVHADARRLGVGKALMDCVLAEGRGLGRRSMELWSDKLFVDAHRFYQRYGAVVVGERLCDDPQQSPEWGLRLDLAS